MAAAEAVARTGIRQQHLATVRSGRNAGGGVDRRTEVVTAALLGLAEVEAHAHPQRRPGPRRRSQIGLRSSGGADRVGRSGERRREGVAGGGEDVPAGALDGVAHDGVVARQRRRHRGPVVSPHAGRTLDVGNRNVTVPVGRAVTAEVSHAWLAPMAGRG